MVGGQTAAGMEYALHGIVLFRSSFPLGVSVVGGEGMPVNAHADNGDGRSAAQRNPPWARDELILALDLYFRQFPKIGDAAHPELIALSTILNAMPFHPTRPDTRQFRNPAGVAMKLNNFRSLDPTYQGTGLSHGSKADKDVWDEFAQDRERLHAVAVAIRACVAAADATSPALDEEEYTAAEGEILLRQHRLRERDRSLVRKKKDQASRRHGVLRCEGCGFVFQDVYGELGEGFIECHHTIPLAHLRPGQLTRLQDLALVCSNCHRMLHRDGQIRSIPALRNAIEDALSRSGGGRGSSSSQVG
jgi:5-methylcytosine-specific restriction enzyme A